MSVREAFSVQLVRERRRSGEPTLQTLQKPLCMRIRCHELVITVPRSASPPPPSSNASTRPSTFLRHFAPLHPLATTVASRARESAWLTVEARLVRSVKVKGRLLRVALQGGQALILCAKDANQAIEAATVMMDAWGIEPLVETTSASEQDVTSIEQLSQLYVDNARFRSLVRQMHEQIDALEVESPRVGAAVGM